MAGRGLAWRIETWNKLQVNGGRAGIGWIRRDLTRRGETNLSQGQAGYATRLALPELE
jgi:hypothetical protein